MSKAVMKFTNKNNNPCAAYLMQCYFIPLEMTAQIEQLDKLKACGLKDNDALVMDLRKDINSLSAQFKELDFRVSAHVLHK